MAPDATLFETDRLLLQGWRMDQIGDLLRLHGDPEIARYLSADGLPWGEDKAKKRLAEWLDNFQTHRMGKLRLIRKSDDQFIGRAGFGLHPPDSTPEIGYALFRDYRGQGYATEAASGLRDWFFRETDGDHFIGFADSRNTPSLKVLRAIGMRETHVEVIEGMTCVFHIYERSEAP